MRDAKLFITALVSSLLFLASATVAAEPEPGSEWQILTKRNFSSQIRLHPQILLMVTVPWSGESRSLMKEIRHLVADKREKFGNIQLMVIYRNSEKMLADVLGAAEGITLLYYHHSISYKYQGRLRAQNVLSSVYHFMLLQYKEVPLKSLHTQKDLEIFFQSTDKAILLLEFCGWSAKLLHEKNYEDNETAPSVQNHMENVCIQEENLAGEAGGKQAFDKMKKQKGLENGEFTCGIKSELGGSPWLEEFTWANQSDLQGTEYRSADAEGSCTAEKFHQFKSFFLRFTKIAREYFLPLERHRFGLVSERSLLPLLGVHNPQTWLVMVQFSGCPNCSIILHEGVDLRNILQRHHSVVMELDVDGSTPESVFSANRPTVILFIDRSSESSKVRGESKSALQVLRKLITDNQLPFQMARGSESDNPESSSGKPLSETWSEIISDHSGHWAAKGLSTPKIVKIKDNVAFIINNRGKSISLDSTVDNQLTSVHDILTHLLHQKKHEFKTKETKISLLAKEAGFQLLSDDFEVQVADSSPSQKEHDQNNVIIDNSAMSHEDQTSNLPVESHQDYVNVNGKILLDANNVLTWDDEEQPELTGTETNLQQNWEAVTDSRSNADTHATALIDELKDNIGTSPSTQVNLDDRCCKQEGLQPCTCSAENSSHLEKKSPIVEKSIEIEQVDHKKCSPNRTCTSEAEQNLSPVISTENLTGNDIVEVKNSLEENSGKRHVQNLQFQGSFFFSDGGYQLLRSLTGRVKIPSLVILDPIQQQHHVFSEETAISYSSLVNFVENFLNGNLTPYRLSAPPALSSREAPRPPFVNLDFHEADSIPRVTASSFCELIIGYRPCEMKHDISFSHVQNFTSMWKIDVLVLFSTSWCGFCQRTELIVREVYRALKNFRIMSKSESKNMDPTYIRDKMEDITNGLPSIFLMDCTLNDCGSFLKPVGKRELYSTLLLFPAENKSAIAYEGDISVVNIIEFLISQGRNSHYLNRHKGFLWTPTWKESTRRSTLYDESSTGNGGATYAKTKYNELLLGTAASQNNQQLVESHTPKNFHEDGHHVVEGSVLAATDKLLGAYPFDNSTVLIVTVEQNQGFQGVIINKQISWNVFKGLAEDLEPLKQAPLFYGGPVRSHGLPLVSLSKKPMKGYTKVIDDIYFGNPVITSLTVAGIKSGNQSAYDYWFFLGYSSWQWDQLFAELAEEAWHLSDSPIRHLDWPDR